VKHSFLFGLAAVIGGAAFALLALAAATDSHLGAGWALALATLSAAQLAVAHRLMRVSGAPLEVSSGPTRIVAEGVAS
jgi:hypothetical protein